MCGCLRTLSVAAMLVGSVVLSAHRASGQQQDSPVMVAGQELHADSASDVRFIKVMYRFFSNGTRRLDGVLRSEGRAPARYFIVADPLNGSYRVFRINTDPFKDERVMRYWKDVGPRLRMELTRPLAAVPQQPLFADQDSSSAVTTAEDPPPVCTYCPPDNLCNGSGQTTVRVWDPGMYLLAMTHAGLDWSRQDSPTGCIWRASGWKNCDPKNPTDWGTHWYTQACTQSPVQKADMYAWFMGYGHYYNSDFGNPQQYTYANTSAGVEFDGNAILHPWGFGASGEY